MRLNFSEWLKENATPIAVPINANGANPITFQQKMTPRSLSPLNVSPKANPNGIMGALDAMSKAINIIIRDREEYKADDPETKEYDPKGFGEEYAAAVVDGNTVKVRWKKTFGKNTFGKMIWSVGDTIANPFQTLSHKGIIPGVLATAPGADPERVYQDILKALLTQAERNGVIEAGTFNTHEWKFDSETFGRDLILTPNG